LIAVFIYLFIHSFIYLLVGWLIYLFICLFIYLLIYYEPKVLSSPALKYWIIYLFIYSSKADESGRTEGSDGGTVAKKAAEFCYDGDEDDDDDDDADDEDDICRELAQLNW